MSSIDCSTYTTGTPNHTKCVGEPQIKAKIDEIASNAASKARQPLEQELSLLNTTYNTLKEEHTSLQANHTTLQDALTESRSACTKILETLGITKAATECQSKSEIILDLFKKAFEVAKVGSHNLGYSEGFNTCVDSLTQLGQGK